MRKLNEFPSEFLSQLCKDFTDYNKIDPTEYTNYKVRRGLRYPDGSGVIAGLTLVGTVKGFVMDEGERHPAQGKLIYRGIDCDDIVDCLVKENRFGFEEVIYLLLFGVQPNHKQLEQFNRVLDSFRALPDSFTEDMIIKAASPDIMNSLARSVLALYSYDENPDDLSLENMLKQCVMLIACLPTIAAYAYSVKKRAYQGGTMHIRQPKPGLSTAENFLRMIRPDGKYTDEEAKLLDLCLVLHAEHGGGNNSAFAARVLSSSGTDSYSVMAAAIGSLKGPLHGGANNKVCAMMEDIEANVKNWESKDEVFAYLQKIMRKEVGDKSGKIYGMGHAVYTLSDPRAVILKERARNLAQERGKLKNLKLIESIEEIAPQVFAAEKGDGKIISANVDMYTGFIYDLLNIPRELFTPIFAISRIAGWCAHRIEEVTLGGRIIRPAYKSLAPKGKFIPFSDRK